MRRVCETAFGTMRCYHFCDLQPGHSSPVYGLIFLPQTAANVPPEGIIPGKSCLWTTLQGPKLPLGTALSLPGLPWTPAFHQTTALSSSTLPSSILASYSLPFGELFTNHVSNQRLKFMSLAKPPLTHPTYHFLLLECLILFLSGVCHNIKSHMLIK